MSTDRQTNNEAQSDESDEIKLERIRSNERIENRKTLARLIGRVAPRVFTVIGVVLVTGIVAWAVVASAPYLAGTDTSVSVAITIAAGITRNLYWGVVALAIGLVVFVLRLYRRQTKLHERDIQRFTPGRREEQLRYDPNRESSELNDRGYAPEDEP